MTTAGARTLYKEHTIEEYRVTAEPFYIPVSDEIELFEAAWQEQIPVLLKGPTGTGKTRFIEYMSHRLGRPLTVIKNRGKAEEDGQAVPLVTVACHEDLTASDLVGRFLLEGDGTRWIDGPLTRAVKVGAICYLDEIVEARKDTTVIIHPLTDHRRMLTVDKLGKVIEAHPGFLMVISYNPGYQSALKELKHSTRQRFVAMSFDFLPREKEAKVIEHEAGIDATTALLLARLGEKIRNLKEHGLQEGVSTRSLIYAGKLIRKGIHPRRACQAAVAWAITDDTQVQRSLEEVIASLVES